MAWHLITWPLFIIVAYYSIYYLAKKKGYLDD